MEGLLQGDWIELVKKDLEDIGITFDEDVIKKYNKCEFKSIIKRLLGKHMFKDLRKEQQKHSKIRNICYPKFEVQEYLKTHQMTNHEVSLLFALRSRTSKYFKGNFPFYSDKICPFCGK